MSNKLPDFIKEPGILVYPGDPHFSVGKVWKENAGRRRTATIKEIHTIGFDQMPPVVLDVTAAEDGKRFTKSVRIAGWRAFHRKWSPALASDQAHTDGCPAADGTSQSTTGCAIWCRRAKWPSF
jgi:hypothetical protein